MIPRPNSDEYAEFYAGYVARVPDGDVIQLLHDQRQQLADLLRGVSEQQAEAYPAPGEWNIKEVVGHLNDGERVFSYRALRFSRKDLTPLAGFDQNDFVRESNFSARSLSDLLEEFDHLRAANVLMFKSLTPDMLSQRGIASENPITPRALVYIVVGHADGHIDSLRTVYLK